MTTYSVNDEGYVYPERHETDEAPVLRLFIHSTFTVGAFEKFCCSYKTPSFQCYTRLLPLNTDSYVGKFTLVDYFKYKDSIGFMRELNEHEQSLFKECLFIQTPDHTLRKEQLSFVGSIDEFMMNFDSRFQFSTWSEAIDFEKFHISGGCIVNSLCKQPFPDTSTEEVDINFNGDAFDEFKSAVTIAFHSLTLLSSKDHNNLRPTLIKLNNGSYNVVLPSKIKLRFGFKNVPREINSVSYVLHCSDLDITQVAFTGSQVLCTISFLQAIATKSFLCYTLHGSMDKSILNRIISYYQRGFVFLEPKGFDNLLYNDIMASPILEESREETRKIINDDGEVQVITITYHSNLWPLPNVDSYRLQETFIKRISSQKRD